MSFCSQLHSKVPNFPSKHNPPPNQQINSQKEKANKKIKIQKHTKAEKPIKKTHSQGKSYWSMITHVIFDLIGNNLQSQVMTYLWFGIRIKHLPVRDWYTLSGFLLFLSNPVFPLNVGLETNANIQNLIYGYEKISSAYSPSPIDTSIFF